jgi:Leucine-rich repeat (LRR) protein
MQTSFHHGRETTAADGRASTAATQQAMSLSLIYKALTALILRKPAIQPREPLSNLTWLNLDDNKLEGPGPFWIGELTNLGELDLSSNNLNGVIHKAIYLD